MMMVQYVAANTMLYVQYCQVSRGEEVHGEVSSDEDVLPVGFTYMIYAFMFICSISLFYSIH